MQGAVLYRPRDPRFEEREDPKITRPTDATKEYFHELRAFFDTHLKS
jgi:hypothetical protein